jgi:hypothetical protein
MTPRLAAGSLTLWRPRSVGWGTVSPRGGRLPGRSAIDKPIYRIYRLVDRFSNSSGSNSCCGATSPEKYAFACIDAADKAHNLLKTGGGK